MRIILLAIIAMAAFYTASINDTYACRASDIECNRSSDGTTFKGDRQLTKTISVTVCHGYWDLLDVGTIAGRSTKWWAPVMVFNNWYGDLPEVTKRCKKYSVKAGTELRLFAECVQRIISTGRMYKSGTYTMT